MSNFVPKFSAIANSIQDSMISEILNLSQAPNMNSFAGGLPSSNSFSVQKITDAVNQLMASDDVTAALQYGSTEGYMPLRQWVASTIGKSENIELTADNVLIVTGSQQALDLISKAMSDVDSNVMIESPTDLGALQTFMQYQPNYVAIDSDEHGLMPQNISDETAKSCRFSYVIPNFQNPTGRRLPLDRRKTFAQIAVKNDLLIVEDDPYGELDYQSERLPSLLGLAPNNVVYLGSFSKNLSPGMRLGYMIAPKQITDKLISLKEASDIQTPTFTQMIAYNVVKDGFLDSHIPTIRKLYHERCVYMLSQLEKYMPKEVTWTKPEGGMFIWMTLPKNINTTKLLYEAIDVNVAFVPGETFYAVNAPKNSLRLAFVTVPNEQIKAGIKALGKLIASKI